MLSDDPKEKEEAIRGWMLRQAHFIRVTRTQGHIAPAVRQILLEHPVKLSDWEQIVGDKDANTWLAREQRKGYEIVT